MSVTVDEVVNDCIQTMNRVGPRSGNSLNCFNFANDDIDTFTRFFMAKGYKLVKDHQIELADSQPGWQCHLEDLYQNMIKI